MYPPASLDFIALANAGRYRDALLYLEEVWFEGREEFYAASIVCQAYPLTASVCSACGRAVQFTSISMHAATAYDR